MWEVFDYITGETVGYTDDLAQLIAALDRPSRDYADADTPTNFVPSFA